MGRQIHDLWRGGSGAGCRFKNQSRSGPRRQAGGAGETDQCINRTDRAGASEEEEEVEVVACSLSRGERPRPAMGRDCGWRFVPNVWIGSADQERLNV